jgi:hypothetical protein
VVKRTVTAAAIGGLLLLTCGCGGGDASAGPRPEGDTTSVATSASPTPSPSPTEKATPEAPPLSRFEDRAPVRVARAFSAAVARAINHRQRGLGMAASYMTRHGQHVMPGYAAEDYGRYLPGPNPFTPVGVEVHGKRATIPVCWESGGWAQDRKTKLPAEHRTVDPAKITLRKVGGTWKVDDLLWRKGGSCAQVPVKGVAW